jgi:hypothetical protein
MIFQHANRYQWHNDDPLYDGQRTLSRLRLPFVKAQGYVNLRCVWTLGCPAEIRPLKEYIAPASDNAEVSEEARAGAFYNPAFEELFPGVPVPEVIGASCCAQFAVTAEKTRSQRATMRIIVGGCWRRRYPMISVVGSWSTHGTVWVSVPIQWSNTDKQ